MSRAARTSDGQAERVTAPVLGMVLFLASEVMFFGALFGAYYTLRAQAPGAWPPPGTPEIDILLPIALTAVLLTSSVTAHFAVAALRKGERQAFVRWLALTVVLGAGFLAGEAVEWARFMSEGFTVGTNIFGTLFFTMTGFHALHLVAGLLIFLIALQKAMSSRFEHQRIGSVEAATYYWHFVDTVWIFLAVSLYALTV